MICVPFLVFCSISGQCLYPGFQGTRCVMFMSFLLKTVITYVFSAPNPYMSCATEGLANMLYLVTSAFPVMKGISRVQDMQLLLIMKAV